jgi:hypothetical protein
MTSFITAWYSFKQQSSPAAVTTEAGKDELLGFRIPIEVDGHAGTRVEAMAERDMQGEKAGHALVGGCVVGRVPDLSTFAEVGAEVAGARKGSGRY